MLGQVLLSQALPSNLPASHEQVPFVRSHNPRFEHSASWWALSIPCASSDQAGPNGHVIREQSAPMKPSKHSHYVRSLFFVNDGGGICGDGTRVRIMSFFSPRDTDTRKKGEGQHTHTHTHTQSRQHEHYHSYPQEGRKQKTSK